MGYASSRVMRVGLNLLHAWPDVGGVWNYMADLIAAVAAYDTTGRYVAFTNSASGALVPPGGNVDAIAVRLPAGSRWWRVAYENTVLQARAARGRLDCLHWFAGVQAWWNAVPGAVSVYDLQPFINPGAFSPGKRLYLRVMMTRTVRRAAVLLPISEATADSLRTRWRADRIAVIPPVVNDRFAPADGADVDRFRRRYGLPDRMWLYVAHFYPHKNHAALLRAYQHLRRAAPTTWPLVLRGDATSGGADVGATIEQLGLRPHVIMLPPLDLAELPLLYSAATALVYPSRFEGGGLPVLEAMASGCPVASARIPSLEEYAGAAAEYFDATDVGAIEAAMAGFQASADSRGRRRALGLARAEEFRPARVVPKLLQAYRMAAGWTRA
jgi:glycosyltransferase involved in cell wall biosynthesis